MDLETLAIKKSIQKEGYHYGFSSLIINNHLLIGAWQSLRILSLPDLKQNHNIPMKEGVTKLLAVSDNIIIAG